MFLHILCTLALLLVLTISNGQQSNRREEVTLIDPYAKTINVAVEYASKNQYDHALEILSSILRESPLHFDANQLYGMSPYYLLLYVQGANFFESLSFCVTWSRQIH